MDLSYWQKQTLTKPLFPDVEWNKPERKSQAGKLGIAGGNKLGFAAVAEAYQVALETGAGQVRVLLPESLAKTVPAVITDTLFAPETTAGSLAKESTAELQALGAWADGILLIGDAGRGSETAVAYETFIAKYEGPLTVTRDAVDLVKNNSSLLVERPNTLLVVSFAQLQKLFQSVYYPKVLTFSMQLLQLVEALHKFTITYPCTVVTLHGDHLLMADAGDVITQPWDSPMRLWRGEIAARMATYQLWAGQKNKLEYIASSIAL